MHWTHPAIVLSTLCGLMPQASLAQFSCEETRFGNRAHLSSWSGRHSILYDLDEDGTSDLIDLVSGDVGQFLCGQGLAPVRIENLDAPAGVVYGAVADVNHDGRGDLVVFSHQDGGATLLRNADPSFAPAIEIETRSLVSVSGLAIGDVDDDGHPDIVTRESQGAVNRLYLWRGHGTGHFDLPEVLWDGHHFREGFVLADIDLDGLTDLVAVSDTLDATIIARGLSGTDFGPIEPLIETTVRDRVDVKDLDADGDLDIIQSLHPEPFVAVIRNEGGTLAQPELIPVDDTPQMLTVADMNADGLPDIVSGSGRFSIHHATKVGPFEHAFTTDMPTSSFGERIAAVDVDGDGRRDIMSGRGSYAQVALQYADGSFTSSSFIDDHSAFFAEDLNGDRVLDILVRSSDTQAIGVLHGVADGTFLPVIWFPISHVPRATTVVDLNADGWLDVACTSHDEEVMTILLGGDGGRFKIGSALPTPKYGRSVSAGDLNGDGIIDLATTGGGDTGVPASTRIFLGLGDGTFVYQDDILPDGYPSEERIADLDGDGWNDLLVNIDADTLAVHWGDADGLTAPTHYSFPTIGMRNFATADVDQDGVLEVLVVGGLERNFTVLHQSAPRDLSVGADLTTFLNGRGVATADVNNDGTIDAIVAMSSEMTNVYLGMGNGSFHPARRFVGLPHGASTMKDFDGDGLIDLLMSHDDALRLRRNRCTTCPDDFDADHAIGWSDLLLMLGAWESDATPFDLDHDGTVGPFDLTALLTHWGTCR